MELSCDFFILQGARSALGTLPWFGLREFASVLKAYAGPVVLLGYCATSILSKAWKMVGFLPSPLWYFKAAISFHGFAIQLNNCLSKQYNKRFSPPDDSSTSVTPFPFSWLLFISKSDCLHNRLRLWKTEHCLRISSFGPSQRIFYALEIIGQYCCISMHSRAS